MKFSRDTWKWAARTESRIADGLAELFQELWEENDALKAQLANQQRNWARLREHYQARLAAAGEAVQASRQEAATNQFNRAAMQAVIDGLRAELAAERARVEGLVGALGQCGWCRGEGYEWGDTERLPCHKCQGTGLHPIAWAALQQAKVEGGKE